jgi:hypothetical protein
VSMSDELKGHNILKLILIVRSACATLDLGHSIILEPLGSNQHSDHVPSTHSVFALLSKSFLILYSV